MSSDLATTGDAAADPMAAFKERVLAKVREDIAAMLPDEALAGLVQKAVEQQFFQPRVIRPDGWSSRTEEHPSWFVEEVATRAKPVIEQVVRDYVDQHHDAIDRAVKEFLDDKSLVLVALAALRQQTSSDMTEFATHVAHLLQQNR